MKLAALAAAFSVSIPLAAVVRAGGPEAVQARGQRPAQVATASPDKVAEAYAEFLLGHRAEESEDEAGAIAAYKRAMALDPSAADIPAELAGLYLRQNKVQEAMAAAEQALKISSANREANRVLGTIYAALSESTRENAPRGRGDKADENLTKAIHHLELAIDRPAGEADPNVRAGEYEKAIPMLSNLVNQEPGWQDGPMMLAEAFAGAGRVKDAISWLEQRASGDARLLPTLADFYERERRWSDAAATYARALQRTPRAIELKSRYASALMNAGGRENIGKARDALNEVIAARTAPDARALYLLSQAQRRLGEPKEAEATARRVIAQNSKSPWGYYALAEALEERRQYQAVVDELA